MKNNKTKLNNEIKDLLALIIHYKKFHKENIQKHIENAYPVQFLKGPKRTYLDLQNNSGIKKTEAKIN